MRGSLLWALLAFSLALVGSGFPLRDRLSEENTTGPYPFASLDEGLGASGVVETSGEVGLVNMSRVSEPEPSRLLALPPLLHPHAASSGQNAIFSVKNLCQPDLCRCGETAIKCGDLSSLNHFDFAGLLPYQYVMFKESIPSGLQHCRFFPRMQHMILQFCNSPAQIKWVRGCGIVGRCERGGRVPRWWPSEPSTSTTASPSTTPSHKTTTAFAPQVEHEWVTRVLPPGRPWTSHTSPNGASSSPPPTSASSWTTTASPSSRPGSSASPWPSSSTPASTWASWVPPPSPTPRATSAWTAAPSPTPPPTTTSESTPPSPPFSSLGPTSQVARRASASRRMSPTSPRSWTIWNEPRASGPTGPSYRRTSAMWSREWTLSTPKSPSTTSMPVLSRSQTRLTAPTTGIRTTPRPSFYETVVVTWKPMEAEISSEPVQTPPSSSTAPTPTNPTLTTTQVAGRVHVVGGIGGGMGGGNGQNAELLNRLGVQGPPLARSQSLPQLQFRRRRHSSQPIQRPLAQQLGLQAPLPPNLPPPINPQPLHPAQILQPQVPLHQRLGLQSPPPQPTANGQNGQPLRPTTRSMTRSPKVGSRSPGPSRGGRGGRGKKK